MEVTNTGNGWHPHVHALIDCEWLAVKTPKPRPRESATSIAAKCKAAAAEFCTVWAKCLRTPVNPSIKVKRCDYDAAKEVLKYAVKPADLINCPDPIGHVIRMMDATRLITTFGTLFGLKVPDDDEPTKLPCTCGQPDWTPYLTFCRDVDAQHARERKSRVRAARHGAR